MAKSAGCYTEEQIVDLLLNHASDEEQFAFRRHCQQCAPCSALAHEWQETLVASTSSAWRTSSERVKQQVWSQLERSVTKRGRFAWLRSKPIAAAGILGVFLCLALLMELHLMWGSPSRPFGPQSTAPPLAVTHSLVKEAEPVYYTVRSSAEPLVDGYVTINPATEEVYIFVQGIPTMINQDYQAWLMKEKSPIDMGIIRLEDGSAELYKQAKELRRVNTLRISIEPKGGSLYPTGPDFIFIHLDQQ